ncbi:MAG: SPOR domain-containing protein [Candidatus Neomarinimicrobiota bacterium]
MLRLLILIIFSSTIFTQGQKESWLDYVIEENKEEISETSSINIESEFYYIIQISVKKTFDEAMEVVQSLNASDIDAFIQKNDSNSEFKYRVRYGNFSNRNDAEKLAENIKIKFGYNCWIDKTEL